MRYPFFIFIYFQMKNQFICRYIVHHSTYKGEHVYAIDDFPQI